MAVKDIITEAIADVLVEWGNERLENARAILRDTGAVASSVLLQSITSMEVKISNGVISIPFGFIDGKEEEGVTQPSVYWQYIDGGVKGTGVGKKPVSTTGKFAFKTTTKRIPHKPIQKWMTAKGEKPPSDFMEGESETDRVEGYSYVIAGAVKKKGINKTLFWTNTFTKEAYKELSDRISKKIGEGYTIQLKGI